MSEQKSKLTTLCYIEKDDCYLMMHRTKKKDDVNEGKWIGVGGHFEAEESPEECLLREVYEETGLKLLSYRLRGIITFISKGWGYEYMFLYTADAYEGADDEETLSKCNEGELSWISKDKIFDLSLWEGDKVFLKRLIDEAPLFELKLVYEDDRLVEMKESTLL